MRQPFIVGSVGATLGVLALGLVWPGFLWLLLPLLPVVAIGGYDLLWSRNNVARNYPFFGRIKTLLAAERHIPQQAVIQNSREGRPFSVVQRQIVAGRTRDVAGTQPYGSELELREIGGEWLAHSAYPKEEIEGALTLTLGGPRCTEPFTTSILNVSAMSFGSLGPNAIEALSRAAALGGFALNTGEGGVSKYHRRGGGDLIYQLGTGYFGCRDEDGSFSAEAFVETVSTGAVKAIEIKISQGAKPGLGGILPAEKNTEEIAEARGVGSGEAIHSPASHSEFSSPEGLLDFAERLRELAGGRPVGAKLCLGREVEMEKLCAAMVETGKRLDFVTIDSADGGTGAGVSDFVNWVGWTIDLALPLVHRQLTEHGLRDEVKLIVSGKVVSSFDVVRMLALGADGCNSARAMMQALGCVQALKCNTNRCPSGVATLDRSLNRGLVVADKSRATANFHRHTVDGVKKLISAAGLDRLEELDASHLRRRTGLTEVSSL